MDKERSRSHTSAPEDEEFFALPEEAIEYLPAEWQQPVQSLLDDGRAVLKSVDRELSQLSRIVNSISTLVTLKYIRDRMVEFKFAPTMEAVLENEILTTSFVVTYARFYHGGDASGFSRDDLPEKLKKFHDEIIEFRNRRYAHNDGHHSVSQAMEISFSRDTFSINPTLSLGAYVGGALEWREIVDFLDAMTYLKMEKLLNRLKARTGRNWEFPTEPKTSE